MNLSEVAKILKVPRTAVRTLISSGILIENSQVRLGATPNGSDFEISDAEFDAFQKAKDANTLGENTPIGVIRILRVESNMRCGICKIDSFLEYHHMIENSKIKHYDPANMLAVCPNCHAKINSGDISYKQQLLHKENLLAGLGAQIVEIFGSRSPVIVKWEDIANVITAIDKEWNYDGTDIITVNPNQPLPMSEKNSLNNMDDDYFSMIKKDHEPYFEKVREFLTNPTNRQIKKKYLGLMEDLRQISLHTKSHKTGIHSFMISLYGKAAEEPEISNCKPVLAILISFMYVSCDLGLKT